MDEEKKVEKEMTSKKGTKVVMMDCCPEDATAEETKENVLLTLGGKFEGRSNVVMTRLNDEDLKQIGALVEVGGFKSRSEATAFFVKEGIRARKDLFHKVMPTVEKIRELKERAKRSLDVHTE